MQRKVRTLVPAEELLVALKTQLTGKELQFSDGKRKALCICPLARVRSLTETVG
jgi:hypothetical protein